MSRILWSVAMLLVPSMVAGQSAELIERTLAIVEGQAVTLSDVRTAMALGLIDGTTLEEGSRQLVDRALILREVQRYAPPEPPEAQVDARIAEIRAHAGSAGELAQILAAGGFSGGRLRAWVRDDLRIAAYLSQRFAVGGAASQDLIDDWVADLRRRTPVVELWRTPPLR